MNILTLLGHSKTEFECVVQRLRPHVGTWVVVAPESVRCPDSVTVIRDNLPDGWDAGHLRTLGLKPLSSGWVLHLDSDESITPEQIAEYDAVCAAQPNDVDVICVPRRNITPRGDMIGWPDQRPMLHRCDRGITWRYRTEELPVHKGRMIQLPNDQKYAITHNQTSHEARVEAHEKRIDAIHHEYAGKFSLAQIELNTACPARCKMCPRLIGTRQMGVMDDATFWKAVEQVYALGVRTIAPFNNGEPLADTRTVSFIERMAKEYKDVEIGWFTNAALLTEDYAKRLLAAGNIKTFNVSFHGGTKEQYERNMGLDFDKTVSNIKTLMKLRSAMTTGPVMRLIMVVFSATAGTENEFRALGHDLGIEPCLSMFSNFGGMVRDSIGEKPALLWPRLKCDRALHHVYIYWNGDVGQCCFDLVGKQIYGNINNNTLVNIMAGPHYARMRWAHQHMIVDEMPELCKNCNSCRFHG